MSDPTGKDKTGLQVFSASTELKTTPAAGGRLAKLKLQTQAQGTGALHPNSISLLLHSSQFLFKINIQNQLQVIKFFSHFPSVLFFPKLYVLGSSLLAFGSLGLSFLAAVTRVRNLFLKIKDELSCNMTPGVETLR